MIKKQKIGILDLGLGNLGNVLKICNHFGLQSFLVKSEKDIKKIDKLILPGVGSFEQFNKNIKHNDTKQGILNHIKNDKTTLAICLGMQTLAKRSYEGGEHEGLGIIDGEVLNLKSIRQDIITPNFGWYKITRNESSSDFFSEFLNKDFYFAHSFFCNSFNKNNDVYINLNGNSISAGFAYKNIIGTQFHPELSGKNGLCFYNKFFSL